MFTYGRLQEALALPSEERPRASSAGSPTTIEAGELTEIEVLSMLTVFVSAGSETTASLLATAVETLARDPELQERLRREPRSHPRRHRVDPARRRARSSSTTATRRTTPSIGGVDIPAGSRVLLMWAAANRPAPGVTPRRRRR